jgi:transposase InsO family protein
MLRGAILAIVEQLFLGLIPSVEEYAAENGVAPSTFRRTAAWLLGLLPTLLLGRRPGPQSPEESSRLGREEALKKLEDLRSWLLGNRSPTEKNDCYSGEAKQRIASVSGEIQATGILTFPQIAKTLEIHERQLRRIRDEVKEAQGGAPEPKSRKPNETSELSEEIQRLIQKIEKSADTREPYSGMDIKRILEKNYRAELLEHTGSATISKTTVLKYMDRKEEEPEREHPRGNYVYPEPFQQVAVDTSYFILWGRVFYLITVFEFGARLNLVTRVFLKENTEAVAEVLEEYLERFPGIGVTVIDRGSPYLNEEVRLVIEQHGKLRIVCPPQTPEAKAACERHFLTLKEVIQPAILKVFPEDPSWEPERFQKVIEAAVAVFQELYHRIPQPGIDGKSPAERATSFDPLRARASMVELFQRSLDSEPAEVYAREIHRRFQFPGSEEETVKTFRRFPTSILRRVAGELEAQMGPPAPDWMYDPLGYFTVKVRELWLKEQEAFHTKELQKEKAKKRQEEEKHFRENLDREAREWQEHPERFVDKALRTLMTSLQSGIGLSLTEGQLKDLLVSLSGKLGRAFSSEVARLKARIRAFTEDLELRLKAENSLDALVRSLSP